MLKTLLDKKKRENIREHVDVVFAAFTIISFAIGKYQKSKAAKQSECESEGEETEQSETAS